MRQETWERIHEMEDMRQDMEDKRCETVERRNATRYVRHET